MSYSVAYNPEMKDRYPTVEKQKRKLPAKPILLVLAVLAAAYMIAGSGVLRYCIPGDPDVTTAAFSEMVEQISEGERVQDALIDFCKEIIYNES